MSGCKSFVSCGSRLRFLCHKGQKSASTDQGCGCTLGMTTETEAPSAAPCGTLSPRYEAECKGLHRRRDVSDEGADGDN